MSLTLISPGVLTLLVDHGRPRNRALGVPLGGAADRTALAIGNALVGNAGAALALEFTLSGPTLHANAATACVVFGAPFSVSVGGRVLPVGTTFMLAAGETLRIGGTPHGVRGYLCVPGGFDAPVILGSRSSLEPLKSGAILECSPSRCEARGVGFVTLLDRVQETDATPVRVLDGPQRDWFAGDQFFTQSYEVTAASNRMGLRLKGEPLTRRAGELVSEAVAPGAVQITNDGLPVVLGVDGQTIGGYPKVAHVIRADLDVLAQLRPGDRVRFLRVTLEEAEAAARELAALQRQWLARLRVAERVPELS